MTTSVTFSIDQDTLVKLMALSVKLGVSNNRVAKYVMLQNLRFPVGDHQLQDLIEIRDNFDALQRPKSRTPRLLE